MTEYVNRTYLYPRRRVFSAVVGQMAERQMTERTYGPKTNDRKTNGRETQDRAEIWPKGRLTENCI